MDQLEKTREKICTDGAGDGRCVWGLLHHPVGDPAVAVTHQAEGRVRWTRKQKLAVAHHISGHGLIPSRTWDLHHVKHWTT